MQIRVNQNVVFINISNQNMTVILKSPKKMTPNAVAQSEYYTFENSIAVSDKSLCTCEIPEIVLFMWVSGDLHASGNSAFVIDNFAKSRIYRHNSAELSSRSLFQFRGNGQDTRKEYAGRKLVGYSAGQMFDVVADVEHYFTFVPFCKKSEIQSRDGNSLKASLVIGFPPIVESYTSHVTLVRPHLVKAVCTDGKLFNHLLTTWKFTDGLKNNHLTCIIDFYVSFDFNSPLYSHLANIFFNELVRQMESAFYDEAKSRYGKPSIKTIQLRI